MSYEDKLTARIVELYGYPVQVAAYLARRMIVAFKEKNI